MSIKVWEVHNDAPSSGLSSIELRGYIRGQYLAEHVTLVEVEERYAFGEKWGLTAFGGIACLYGKDLHGNNTSAG